VALSYERFGPDVLGAVDVQGQAFIQLINAAESR